MKTYIKYTSLRILVLILISSFTSTALSGLLISGSAHAAGSVAPIADRLSNFTMLNLLYSNCNLRNKINLNDVADGNWGNDGGFFSSAQSFPGYDIGNDGDRWGCAQLIKDGASSLWVQYSGYDGNSSDFLKKIGYEENNGYLEKRVPDLQIKTNIVNLLLNYKTNLMTDISYDKSSGKVTPGKPILYSAWFEAFTKGCGATYVSAYNGNGVKQDDRDKANAGNRGEQGANYYKIWNVHSDGTVSLDIFKGGQSGGVGDRHDVINGVGSANSNKADCHEIADVLLESRAANLPGGYNTSPGNNDNGSDSWAQSLAAYVASDPSASNIAGGGSSSDSTVTPGPYDKCFIGIPIIGWLMCAMLQHADLFYKWVQNHVIANLLLTDGSSLAKGQPLYEVWSTFKNISSVLILLIGLFMILTQIFSFDFLSAYTVKKVLPRLIIAAIAIQLSWIIFRDLIFLVNALGSGVEQLMLSPFQDLLKMPKNGRVIGLTDILNSGGSNATNGAIFAGLLALGGAVASAGGAIGLVIAAVGVIITCFIVLFTLIIRYILISALLVLAPIALVMWVLPGTQSIWKNWWSNFSKLLFMFPLIMFLFSAGTIGAYIMVHSTTVQGNIAQFMAIVAYFGPLFLIPATFKYAGSAMAAASGGVSKLGGMVKEKNPVSKSLGKAAQVRQQSKETNAKLDSLSNSKFRRARGRFSTGVYGAKGEARTMMEAHEQSEAIKLESQKLEHDLRGMDGGQRTAALLAAASDKSGGVSRQRAAANALVGMSDVDSLRQLKATMKSNDQENMWNEVQSDNYSALKTLSPEMVNPDNFASTKLGESWDSLSTEQLAGMKPEGFKALQNWMADSSVPQAQRIAVQNKMTALASNPQLLAKADHSINEIQDMANASGALATRNTSEYIKTKRDPSTNAVIRQGTGAGTWRL